MIAQGIRHENEKTHDSIVRMKAVTMTATNTFDEKLLAALVRAIGHGGEIEIRINNQIQSDWFKYQGVKIP